MSDAVKNLYSAVLAEKGVSLNSVNSKKFKQACKRVIEENPNVSFGFQKKAAGVYLGYILGSSGLNL